MLSPLRFTNEDYKSFIRQWVKEQPRKGRGQYRRLAQHLGIHSTMMSHIIGGKQNLSEDQALAVASYMGLSEIETEYFLSLVRLAHATTPALKERIRKQLLTVRSQGKTVKSRIPEHHQLSSEDSARFYSNWFYSALRLLSDIPDYQDRGRLIQSLGLSREMANDAISFLLEKGLCREKGGKIVIGPSRTHLSVDSPYVWTMHKNWRLKAIERHAQNRPTQLFYTAPMSIARADVAKIRELLLDLITKVTGIAAKSDPETLVTLNIDWFDILDG